MEDIWYRLWGRFFDREAVPRQLEPGDRQGLSIYLDLQDCLNSYRYYVLYAVAAITIPMSIRQKRALPFIAGFGFSLPLDMMHSNWRCADKHVAFRQHCDAVQREMQQLQQQHQQQQAQQESQGQRR